MARVSIGSRKHRIVVCSARDVVETPDSVSISKIAVFQGWASVEMKKASTFSQTGFSVQQKEDLATHYVTMNYRPDVDITVAAWMYEERLQSPPRWYKILRYGELDERFWRFEVRLVEKSEDSPTPRSPADAEIPAFKTYDDGVEL